MNLKSQLGKNIAEIRKARGFKRKPFAALLGISIQGLKDIESGRSFPRSDKIEEIAMRLGVSWEQLMTYHVKGSKMPLPTPPPTMTPDDVLRLVAAKIGAKVPTK